MGMKLSDLVENIVEKGEIVFLFLQYFQHEYLWSKGLTIDQATLTF